VTEGQRRLVSKFKANLDVVGLYRIDGCLDLSLNNMPTMVRVRLDKNHHCGFVTRELIL
jgi:hypothetical protein